MLIRLVALLSVLFSFAVAAQQAPATSVMVVEAHSGKVLIATNSSAKRPVASLTKMATAVVAVDWATATETDINTFSLTAPQSVALVGGPNPMNLQPGDSLTLRDALNSMLLGSDNLAALTVADNIGRQIMARRGQTGDPVVMFVGEMNKLAKYCGMTQTKFANPHGLERPGAVGTSTAADMARLGIIAMRRNAINFIIRQSERRVSVTGPAGTRNFTVRNTHQLIGQDGIIGIKTGQTLAAGPCLATCADKPPIVRTLPNGQTGATPRRLVVVVLNSPDRFGQTRDLLTRGWAEYDAWIAAGAPVRSQKREILSVPKE
jgi:D-alanyl-D-alanine carboxypeptidase (penicillin-binding protein 5/6)